MIGLSFGQRPRDLLAIILTHRKHLSMQRWGRHRHCRQWRPSRILAWLQQTRVSGSHHIDSSYLEQPPQESKNAQELGSLHEAGRATAQFTPPFWRDCSGNKNPAQFHHKSASQNSSLENRSIPSLLKKSKNRRGYRSEAAHLSRLERERDKRAKRRREARNIKSRWRGLPREDLEIVLHFGTPGLRDGNMLQETPTVRDRDRTERLPPLQGSAPEQQTVSSYLSSSSHSTSDSSSSSSPSSSASSSSASSSSLPAGLALTTSFAKSEGPRDARQTQQANRNRETLVSEEQGQEIKELFASFASDDENPLPEWAPNSEVATLFQSFASGDESHEPPAQTLSGALAPVSIHCSELPVQTLVVAGMEKTTLSAPRQALTMPRFANGVGIEGQCRAPSANSIEQWLDATSRKARQTAARISRASSHQAQALRIQSPDSYPLHLSGPQAPAISHHISPSGRTPGRNQNQQEQSIPGQEVQSSVLRLQNLFLKICTYNIRGLKRFGRLHELSHLIRTSGCDIIGIQETKCTGNTLTTLADGFLLNSSDNPLANKEEHRGTGLIFKKTLAHSLYKTYQGSSRWCGALFSTLPVPILTLSVYAPTAAAPTEEKERFYQEIGEIIAENGGAFLIILGDFNAKLLTDPGLPRHIGQNIFQSAHPLGTHTEETLENRDLFLDFLIQHDLVALNTFAPVAPDRQVTFRYPAQPEFRPPWLETNFAQIDYILTKSRFRNDFASVKTNPQQDYDSDHIPVSATVQIKWRFGKKPPPPKIESHNRGCTPEAKRAYNTQLGHEDFNWATVRDKLTQTALRTRGKRPPNARQVYITQETLSILEIRDQALERGWQAESRRLTNLFRRHVKLDRKNHITEQLRTFTGAKQNWPAIKRLRSKFLPKFSKRGQNKSSIPSQFPNDCASYFATTHWKAIPPIETADAPPFFPQIPDQERFTIEELNEAIDNLKKNKSGGPDAIITELLHDLDETNRTKLLALYNEIYDTETIPDHFNEAQVVQIYKPGKIPEQYSSYRPIALLNVTYKVFAKLLQTRLRDELDHRLVPFQFGYRQGKSTSEPIFIARRAQEIAERHGTQLYMLALDYSKAFDSIPHGKLTESLRRLGASQKHISLVAEIYRNPRFRIRIPEGISEEHQQDIGIRQGCPLSPYLYIIATSCLMQDFLTDYNKQIHELPEGTQSPTLLFADDTLLLTKTAKQMTDTLALIIDHSDTYNLSLNKEKCQLLVTNDLNCPVYFPDRTLVAKHDSIKYLGVTFHAKLDMGYILRQKLSEAAQTMRILAPLWSDSQITPAWKLTVFNAIIRTRIFYTLETLQITPSQQKKLDTLYYRGLRRILKKPSTYIDRTWTHERLLQTANQITRPMRQMRPRHIPFSTYYIQRRIQLLGHLLRANRYNLSRLAVLTMEDTDRINTGRKKRVGRPRNTWLQESLKEAWHKHTQAPWQEERAIPTLKDLAERRAQPF